MQHHYREFVILTPSLGVIPCEYHHKWYIAKNQILWAKFLSQKVSIILYYCRSATKRKLWKSTFSEGVRNFKRQFRIDGDVARNRSMDRWVGEWCSCNFAAGSFHTKKLCSRLFSRELNFIGTNSDIAFLCHPLGDLGVTYTVHLWLVGKRVVDFL